MWEILPKRPEQNQHNQMKYICLSKHSTRVDYEGMEGVRNKITYKLLVLWTHFKGITVHNT
jgi:hypothetical protein